MITYYVLMKVGTLVAGLFLMMMGVVIFLWIDQAVANCGSIMGKLGGLFSGSFESQCKFANLIQIFGGLVFVGGIVTTIGGAVSSSKKVITPNVDNVVPYCQDCNDDLSKEELESHQCNNCGSIICACDCHNRKQDTCKYCINWH